MRALGGVRPQPVHRPEQQLVPGGTLEVEMGVVLPGEPDPAVQLDPLTGSGPQSFQRLREGEPTDPLPAVDRPSGVVGGRLGRLDRKSVV